MKRFVFFILALAGCTAESTVAEVQPSPKIVRLDEPGEQGIDGVESDMASSVLATLAETESTAVATTRLQEGFHSTYLVFAPEHPYGFAFERYQTESGTAFSDEEADFGGAPWRESIAALYDNREAGDVRLTLSACAQGAIAETGFNASTSRVAFDITWPYQAKSLFLKKATATAFAPTLGRLLGAPLRETVRDGVVTQGYLRWETEGPLEVPEGVAERAFIILYRGLPIEEWKAARHDGKVRGWIEAVRDRDILAVQDGFVHGPTSALAGEIEWLTGAIPAHAGYINGGISRRERVGDIGDFVAGDIEVIGGKSGLYPIHGTAETDHERIVAALKSQARIVVLILDEPANAFRNDGSVEEVLRDSSKILADGFSAWRSEGRMDSTIIAFGSTHGMVRCESPFAATAATIGDVPIELE